MRFATSYIHALTGTCEVGLLERYDTIVYYRPKHRTAPECTVVQHQFGIGMHLVRVHLIPHEDVRPNRLVRNLRIDQFRVDGNYLGILVRIFHKQRISTSVGAMSYYGHLARILARDGIFQEMYSIYRTINKVIEDSLVLDVRKFVQNASWILSDNPVRLPEVLNRSGD